MAHPIRNYARLVLKTFGARGLTYLGDFSEGVDILRTATIAFLREIPGMTRATMARQLGISLRTVADWTRLVRASDGEEAPVEPSPTREGLIFMEIMQLLHRSGDAFVSLGRIAEHVKSRVDRRLTTMEIGKRLETYARLELVESSPEETDAYRLTVRPPTRVESARGDRSELVAYLLSVVFDLGYQVFARDAGSHARVEVFRIPLAHRRAFVRNEGVYIVIAFMTISAPTSARERTTCGCRALCWGVMAAAPPLTRMRCARRSPFGREFAGERFDGGAFLGAKARGASFGHRRGGDSDPGGPAVAAGSHPPGCSIVVEIECTAQSTRHR